MGGYDYGDSTSGGSIDKDHYWAAKPTDEVGDEILRRVSGYHEFINITGRLAIWQSTYKQYYNAIRTYADIQRAGDSGQFSLMSVNELRNNILHVISLCASDRLAFDPVSINTDAEAIAQCTLAQGLLDYYMHELDVEQMIKLCLETCLWGGDGFMALGWDVGAGDEYGVDETGNPRKTGDIKIKTYHPGTCVRDYSLLSPKDERYRILIDLESRFELMAKYPQLADRIKTVSTDKRLWQYLFYLDGTFYSNDELIPVYELRHEKTDALPNGRIVRMVASDVILVDSPLPYKNTHIYRINPTSQINSIWGYSPAFDMLPIQTAFDSMLSIALSNNATYGVQLISVPQGSEIRQSDVAGGAKILYYNSQLGEPKPLQLTATAPETYNFMNILSGKMAEMAAINPVTKGNTQAVPQLKSGAALALVQSMAIQFNSQLQQSYVNFSENVATGIIELLQSFASRPRVAQIAGKNKKTLMKYWTSNDLSSIRKITVNIGNALTRTVAGRENLAEQFLANGMINNPAQLIEVYNTGKLEPITEYPIAEQQLIRDENESFMNGVYSPPIITDNHDLHIKEHGIVLASVEARKNPGVLNTVLQHIQEHFNLKAQQPPIMSALFNQIPVPPMPIPGPIPGPQEAVSNVQGEAPQPGPLPSPDLPKNPLTGQQFDTQTGGGIVSA
jgi:hypothetical protein